MFYEQRLASPIELSRRLRSLDQDAGIRVVGISGGKEVLVFVTRFGERYTMMTFSVRPRGVSPGKRLETLEFGSPDEVEAILRKLAPGRLRAWIY